MFPFHVGHVAVFRGAKRSAYVQSYHAITLNVSGLRHWQADDLVIDTDTPFFLLSARGTSIVSDHPGDRETWGIIINTEQWRKSATSGKVDICLDDTWTSLPMLTQLDPAHLPRWRREMELLRELFIDRIPLNVIRLKLGVLGIVRFVLEQATGLSTPNTPGRQLKGLLDCPTSRMRPLDELARETGYSPEHMRKLFRAEFGISPAAYRSQCRLAEAMDCVTNTKLSVKEMSYRLGFKHLSHFSQVFKRAFGLSPREAIIRYRS